MRHTLPTLALALLVAACATRTLPPPEPPARPAPPPAPLSPIHQNLSAEEQAFHLRAGLNVAALSCVKIAGPEIVADYNQFLAAKRPQLAAAFEAKAARYRAQGGKWERALDTHMTQLYNHFASPTAQVAFCRQAAAEVKQAIAADPEGFVAWAQPALARLDAPFASTGATAAQLQTAALGATGSVRSSAPGVSIIDLPAGWGIQLGAFSSEPAAEAAWRDISGRTNALQGLTPYFQAVPGKPLVRLQAKGASSRDHAITLCAQAAAAGFECIPIAPV